MQQSPLGLRFLAPLELIAQVLENLPGSLSADAGLSGDLGGANAPVGSHQALDRLPRGVQLLLGHGLQSGGWPLDTSSRHLRIAPHTAIPFSKNAMTCFHKYLGNWEPKE